MIQEAPRQFRVILFGATGFTGQLVARYLATQSDEPFALAGRNRAKLEALAASLPRRAEIFVAESQDEPALRALAARTDVVISTAGPFIQLGLPLVDACIDCHTDYVDITGEPAFVNAVLARDPRAVRAGVRVVNCCGFDSIPHDLGAYLAVQALGPDSPIRLEGFVRSKGRFSGGTWQSAIGAMADWKTLSSPPTSPSTHKGKGDRRARSLRPKPGYRASLGDFVVPLPTIDPAIVLRSAEALDAYGPDFRYAHYARVHKISTLAALGAGVSAIALAAQVPSARRWLQSKLPSGEGPSEAQRKKSSFEVLLQGKNKAGAKAQVRVAGGDPGYDETAKMVAESALCLALDLPRDTSPRAGVLTPAAAMAEPLIARLRRAGLTLETLPT